MIKKLYILLFIASSVFADFQKISEPVINYLLEPIAVPRRDFFEAITGFPESELIKAWREEDKSKYNSLISKIFSDGKIKNSKTGVEYNTGTFRPISIGELDKKLAAKNNRKKLEKKKNAEPGSLEVDGRLILRQAQDERILSNSKPGTFSVIAGENTNSKSWFRYKLDIGALQADSENRDAVFQVASNFSALEPIGISHYPEAGVSDYISDYTQGPFASISAAPGLIYRMYALFAIQENSKEPNLWRQRYNYQLNLLDAVYSYLPVVNGYVAFHNRYLNYSAPVDIKQKIKIGYHENIQVTSGFVVGDKQVPVTDQAQIINQVFTAAVDFGDLNSWAKDNPEVCKRARILLDAAYEGTIKVAVLKNKKKLFLTLIGGGVFNNPWQWISAAIVKNKQFIIDSGLEVILYIYDSSKAKGDAAQFNEQIVKLVQETGGSYTVYKDDGVYRLT